MIHYSGHDTITGLYGRYLDHDFRYSGNGLVKWLVRPFTYLSATKKSGIQMILVFGLSLYLRGIWDIWTFMSGIHVKVSTLNHLNTRLLIQYYLVHSK